MSASRSRIRLRQWQRLALDAFSASEFDDFLAVATPGAGKTTFALTAARMTLPDLATKRLIVVAPTRHLKEQWADAAERFGIYLDPNWTPAGGLAPDLHGLVTTYQQVGGDPDALVAVSAGAMVVLDEIHHAGDERTWGDGVRRAFGSAAKRLALSGTPFRSDTATIPFVRYDNDVVVADVEYGYGEALADRRVVRPVYFPRFGGHMEWSAPDGSVVSASFEDPLARTLANQRLRAALSLEGEWLPTVLGHAHQRLREVRERHPEAGGLIIAMDQAHAWGIADYLRSTFRVVPTVAVSEDPEASDKISRFAAGDAPWIVAVRMVSEGVDIPRLRVGVYATTTTTELFFRQAVGRIVRHTPGLRSQRAYLFLPDDPRLRYWADTMAEARRHRIERRSEAEDDEYPTPEDDPAALDRVDDGEQLSFFEVLSATASDGPAEPDIFDDSADEVDPDDEVDDGEAPELELDLGALPALGGSALRRVDRMERERLRTANAELARELAVVTARSHAQINAELNRLAGVRKVSEARADQLDRRKRMAEEWLNREKRKARMRRFA